MRNLKRALSLAMATVMLMSMTVIGAGALSFNDAEDISNVSAATVLEALEIMIGDDEGNFNPDSVVTRAEMAIILCRVVYGTDYEADGYVGVTTFTDISGHWAEGEIGMAYANGWINGKSAESFDPNATVLAYEAYVMMQRALGYYDAADTTEYSLGTYAMSLASKTGINSGISTGAYTGLTRDSVATAVYNMMFDTPKVAYSEWTKIYYACDVTEDDGNWTPSMTVATISIEFGSTGTFAADVHDVSIVTEQDVMGRPVDAVQVDDETLATSPIAADDVFTAGDEYEDVCDAADGDYDYLYYFAGAKVDEDTIKALFSDDAAEDDDDIDNGYVIEVYNVDNSDFTKTVYVAYFYSVDEIEDIEYDDDEDETTIEMDGGDSFIVDGDVTDTYAEGDMVMYTFGQVKSTGVNGGDDAVDTLAFATAVEGTVTGVRPANYYYLDGTKYSFAQEFIDVTGTSSSDYSSYYSYGDEIAVYVDPMGYVIGEEEIEATVTAYDYLYVMAIDDDVSFGGDTLAIKALFADGSTAIIDVYEINGNDNDEATLKDAIAEGEVYSFDEDDDGYSLDDADYTIAADTAYVLEGYTRLRNNDDGDSAVNYVDGTKYFTDDTVFVDEEEGEIYVGYENVADFDATDDYKLIAVYDDTEVLVLFIIGGTLADSTSGGTYVYFDSASPYYTEIDDDGYYVYTSVYLDGEQVTLYVEASTAYTNSTHNIAADTIYEIETNDDGYVTGIDALYTTEDDFSDYVAMNLLANTVGSSYIAAESTDGVTDYRFSYDSDTVFVYIDEDGDVYDSTKSKIKTTDADTYAIDGENDGDDFTMIHVVYDDDNYALVVFIEMYEDGADCEYVDN